MDPDFNKAAIKNNFIKQLGEILILIGSIMTFKELFQMFYV